MKTKFFSNINWKQNFLKISDSIRFKISNITSENISISCALKVPFTDITSGKYQHLNIFYNDNDLSFEEKIIPHQKVGRYSKYNIYGLVKKRKDLPKIPKLFTRTVPNFGDPSKGYHDISYFRNVYQKEIVYQIRSIQIKVDVLEVNESDAIFKFSIDRLLNKNDLDFEKELLFDINLLQENIGNVDVFKENATDAEYLKTVNINWEILPIGTKDETIEHIAKSMNIESNDALREILCSRYEILIKLKPINFVHGISGTKRYIGAQFSEKLVVFENIEYGNAIYIMFDEWKKLSKLSRIELLNNRSMNFVRIVHNKDWEKKLYQMVEEKRYS